MRSTVAVDERDLIQRLQAGDEEAFLVLVRTHQTNMVRLAMTFVDSRAVAEEVVQDTWLSVVRGIDRFEGRSSVKTWLFHILANRARTTASHERRTLLLDEIEPDGGSDLFSSDGSWASPVPHWSDSVNDRLSAVALAVHVHEAIECLPPAQCQAITLRDVEGLSSAEVCRILDVTEGHQRVLLHRGRLAVRRTLEKTVKGSS